MNITYKNIEVSDIDNITNLLISDTPHTDSKIIKYYFYKSDFKHSYKLFDDKGSIISYNCGIMSSTLKYSSYLVWTKNPKTMIILFWFLLQQYPDLQLFYTNIVFDSFKIERFNFLSKSTIITVNKDNIYSIYINHKTRQEIAKVMQRYRFNG